MKYEKVRFVSKLENFDVFISFTEEIKSAGIHLLKHDAYKRHKTDRNIKKILPKQMFEIICCKLIENYGIGLLRHCSELDGDCYFCDKNRLSMKDILDLLVK